MARWKPNTRERLEQAALDLYSTQGYEQTTVGDISDRVGVTSRTYFRYFPDKREVLFGGAQMQHQTIVAAAAAAPVTATAFEAVIAGISVASGTFRPREFVRRRAAVIATSSELQEREVRKLESLTTALAVTLEERGVDAATARMAADAGLGVLLAATRDWLAGDDAPFETLIERSAQLLKTVVVSRC